MIASTKLEGDIWAGMPFDRVKRPTVDNDLMPRQVDGDMGKILMGQRELNGMRTFPMHGFVGRSDGDHSAIIFSKGNRSYRSFENGDFAISLRRSVEWVTEGNLQNRIGDAGPFFYVPDARCERSVRHEMGIYVGETAPDQAEFDLLSAAYHHTPLIVDVVDVTGKGDQKPWSIYQSDQPIAAVFLENETVIGRKWHATGEKQGLIEIVPMFNVSDRHADDAQCTVLNRPQVRIGHNQGLPDQKILDELKSKIDLLRAEAKKARLQMEAAEGNDKLKAEHQVYIHERELYEFLLSVRLNEQKIEQGGKLAYAYLYEPDPAVTDIGFKLNQLRIKRRIFDYVVTAI